MHHSGVKGHSHYFSLALGHMFWCHWVSTGSVLISQAYSRPSQVMFWKPTCHIDLHGSCCHSQCSWDCNTTTSLATCCLLDLLKSYNNLNVKSKARECLWDVTKKTQKKKSGQCRILPRWVGSAPSHSARYCRDTDLMFASQSVVKSKIIIWKLFPIQHLWTSPHPACLTPSLPDCQAGWVSLARIPIWG